MGFLIYSALFLFFPQFYLTLHLNVFFTFGVTSTRTLAFKRVLARQPLKRYPRHLTAAAFVHCHHFFSYFFLFFFSI